MKRQSHQDDSFIGPLFLWLTIQLLAIALAAARVKLWARFGSTGEAYALDELTVAQFIGSSLLFPMLCRSFKATVAMIAGGLPMIALAGFLSFASMPQWGGIAINLSIWLAGLGVWRKVANRFDAGALVAVALVSTLNIGGLMLAYLRAETNGGDVSSFAAVPILAAIRLSHFPTLFSFISASTILILGVCVLAISSNLSRKTANLQDYPIT